MGMGGQRHSPGALPPGNSPFAFSVGSWVVLDGCGFRTANCLSGSDALYRLRSPVRQLLVYQIFNYKPLVLRNRCEGCVQILIFDHEPVRDTGWSGTAVGWGEFAGGEERMKYNLIVDGKPNTLIEPWPQLSLLFCWYHC
jgi:hypothetical protein